MFKTTQNFHLKMCFGVIVHVVSYQMNLYSIRTRVSFSVIPAKNFLKTRVSEQFKNKGIHVSLHLIGLFKQV